MFAVTLAVLWVSSRLDFANEPSPERHSVEKTVERPGFTPDIVNECDRNRWNPSAQRHVGTG